MKLNHNIYKIYLNKSCSQKDFFSSSYIHVQQVHCLSYYGTE